MLLGIILNPQRDEGHLSTHRNMQMRYPELKLVEPGSKISDKETNMKVELGDVFAEAMMLSAFTLYKKSGGRMEEKKVERNGSKAFPCAFEFPRNQWEHFAGWLSLWCDAFSNLDKREKKESEVFETTVRISSCSSASEGEPEKPEACAPAPHPRPLEDRDMQASSESALAIAFDFFAHAQSRFALL